MNELNENKIVLNEIGKKVGEKGSKIVIDDAAYLIVAVANLEYDYGFGSNQQI